ncbi:hypothetical protein RB3758 [Rhodopirellula baltica SH 1]|uniref:Uncharacterized protein n=1 Tax=Rhodopirellula baltica (strain DSM 10527 / NCIMB 13988 / SH1) TaxID=243090 RepID=Q7UTP6_RHOBA|nr:hypothetical protein RB3758 [Rhodopirellula baltica SH 1]
MGLITLRRLSETLSFASLRGTCLRKVLTDHFRRPA